MVSDEMLEFHKGRMAVYARGSRAVQASPGYFGLGDANNIPGPNVKHPRGIRYIADWYTAPLLYPDYVRGVFEIETERAIESFKKYYAAFGNDVDVVYICGADFGSQRGPLINPEIFRTIYAPYYKKVTDWIHSNTGWKVIKHCCGCIFPIIPFMIEVGIDALNPVQCSAEGMDPGPVRGSLAALACGVCLRSPSGLPFIHKSRSQWGQWGQSSVANQPRAPTLGSWGTELAKQATPRPPTRHPQRDRDRP